MIGHQVKYVLQNVPGYKMGTYIMNSNVWGKTKDIYFNAFEQIELSYASITVAC